MKTVVNQSKNGGSILVEFIEGFSTYKIAVPMPHAVNFFLEGLSLAMGLLTQKKEFQAKLEQQGKKSEIQETLKQVVYLFESFLKESGR